MKEEPISTTFQYRFDASNSDVPVYTFSKNVDGKNMQFQVVSTDVNDGIIYEEGNYSSINNQSSGFLALDSLIYAGFYELTVVSLSNNITLSDTFSFQDPTPLYFDYTNDNPQSCVPFGNIYINNISGGTAPYSLGKVNALSEFDIRYIHFPTKSTCFRTFFFKKSTQICCDYFTRFLLSF